MSQELDKYQEYAKQVLSGEINACKHIKNACSRYLSWFDRDDIEFRPDKADKVVNFASKLKHSTGSSNPRDHKTSANLLSARIVAKAVRNTQ